MNDDRRAAIVPLIMIIATVALGWVALRKQELPPLSDTRTEGEVPANEQDVVARLWEDPLAAVQRESKEHHDHESEYRHSIERLAEAVQDRADANRICFLVVPIPETPFPDDSEMRLRLRYSIQMALAEAQYAPDSRNYLGYFELESCVDANNPRISGSLKRVFEAIFPIAALLQPAISRSEVSLIFHRDHVPIPIPYEWFVPRTSNSNRLTVLVMWLPESQLQREPLALLALLRNKLGPKDPERLTGVYVIGPQSSDLLPSFVEGNLTPGDQAALRRKLSIFSPQATTPDALVGLDPKLERAQAREDLDAKLRLAIEGTYEAGSASAWRYFHNFIAPDDQVTDLLAAELALRGVDLSSTNDTILILSEADTSYGYSLPIAFEASCQTQRERTNFNGSLALTAKLLEKYAKQRPETLPQLLIYRYLRGLDLHKGREESDKRPAGNFGMPVEELLAEVLTKQGAMPAGASQLDYVDRLAADLQRSCDKKNIKAVGVLGADVYDKLILLRSLRTKFPGAVFFTTDMDARLWHPNHLPFTRNLIVASAYGVDARPDPTSTQKFPPFRDAYQVAAFEACRAAVKKATNYNVEVPLPPPASIFELSRNGPRLLATNVTVTPKGFLAKCRAMLKRSTSAERAQSRAGKAMPVLGFGLLLLGLVGGPVGWALVENKPRWWLNRLRPHRWLLYCLGISFTLFVCFGITTHTFSKLQGGEPWALSEGISIWPTELVRLLIVLVVGTTLIGAWRHHLKGRRTLMEQFDLPLQVMGIAPHRSAIRQYEKYLISASRRRRAGRVTICTLAYLAVLVSLTIFIEGHVPLRPNIRGDLARWVDGIMLSISMISFIALIFYVLDAVLISARLLHSITGPVTKWPQSLLNRHKTHFDGAKEEELACYLDVLFAAQKSKDTGKLILVPFVVQIMLMLSLNSYFDNWTLQGILLVVLGCNIALASTAWVILRRAAKRLRRDALTRLQKSIDETDQKVRQSTQAIELTGAGPTYSTQAAPSTQRRHASLEKMRQEIEQQYAGAYARWFQDPALLAIVIPSGVVGLLTIIIRALFGAI